MKSGPFGYRIRGSAILDVTGDDRVAFLQGQITQDVRLVSAGGVLPAAALTPKGKLLFVARLAGLPDRLRLVLPGALRERARAHLAKYAVFQKVVIEDRTDDLLRFSATDPLNGDAALPDGALRLGPEGEFAEDILVSAESRGELLENFAARGVRPLSDADAEALRVEAGRPRFGQDADESNLADEVGLFDAVSTVKGCYVGQEIVARLRTYGKVQRRLVGFRFPDGGIPAGTRLERAGAAVPSSAEPGRITSSVESARFGPIGLGWAFRDVGPGDSLVSAADPPRRAILSTLPFSETPDVP